MDQEGQPPPTVAIPLSQEEQANIELSRRRGKRLRQVDQDVEEIEMEEVEASTEGSNPPQTAATQRLSYKDKLANTRPPP